MTSPDLDTSLAQQLVMLLRSDGEPTPDIRRAMRQHGIDCSAQLGTELDRLTIVFQLIPERASLFLARAFLRHSAMERAPSSLSTIVDYAELVGEPARSERRESSTTSWPSGRVRAAMKVAFWADGWKLARYAAQYGRATMQSRTEAQFQLDYTVHILRVLGNRM